MQLLSSLSCDKTFPLPLTFCQLPGKRICGLNTVSLPDAWELLILEHKKKPLNLLTIKINEDIESRHWEPDNIKSSARLISVCSHKHQSLMFGPLIWADLNTSVKWHTSPQSLYSDVTVIFFLSQSLIFCELMQHIARESHTRHCAESHGKFCLVLSYFIVSFNQTQNSYRPKENTWFLYVWKCNTSFMVDLNPLVTGGVFFHFRQVWKLLSPYKLSLSFQYVILSENLSGCWGSLWRSQSRAESHRKTSVLSVLPIIPGSHQKRWFWRRWWRHKVILREMKLYK